MKSNPGTRGKDSHNATGYSMTVHNSRESVCRPLFVCTKALGRCSVGWLVGWLTGFPVHSRYHHKNKENERKKKLSERNRKICLIANAHVSHKFKCNIAKQQSH